MLWFYFVSALPEGQTPNFRIHCPLGTDLINFIFMSEAIENLYVGAYQPDSIVGHLLLGETQIIWYQSNLIFFLPLKPVCTYLRFCRKFPMSAVTICPSYSMVHGEMLAQNLPCNRTFWYFLKHQEERYRRHIKTTPSPGLNHKQMADISLPRFFLLPQGASVSNEPPHPRCLLLGDPSLRPTE